MSRETRSAGKKAPKFFLKRGAKRSAALIKKSPSGGLKNHWFCGIVVITMVEFISAAFLSGRSLNKRQTTNDKRQTTNDKKIMGAVLALSSPLRRNPVIF
ncbi:MAG: hypothetical protein LBD13_07945 [Spirochaetaceae bacterium]|jgi:hypothetical protein|nr:hypothetical protein [Spirochaetaceae bacterium]